ncbi:hypothetical protein HYALB_00001556 [Hymenoscyphus albidus]|uniref:Uncharacterized protein n=1 Tax=Hymenoscyphus albidus TaxID=595503 RepID=A0A9N9PWL6_9HELO|nr:hypothetical protein HYALB_00001556 [Hymenoscyphus albidus]
MALQPRRWTLPEYFLASLLFQIAGRLRNYTLNARIDFLVTTLPYFERDIRDWGGQSRTYERHDLTAKARDGFLRRALADTGSGFNEYSYIQEFRPCHDMAMRAISDLYVPAGNNRKADIKRALSQLSLVCDEWSWTQFHNPFAADEVLQNYDLYGGVNGDKFPHDFQNPRNKRER